MIKSKLSNLLGLVPAAVIAACVCISLSGYEKPTFDSIQTSNSQNTDDTNSDYSSTNVADVTSSISDTSDKESSKADKPSKDDSSKSDKTDSKVKSAPTIQTVSESGSYADGTYIGTGSGFVGQIKVQVTVSGGKISAIQVLETSDGSEYMSKAKSLINSIVSSQSTNVDAVSGATYSSSGIIEAVRNALSKAHKNGSTQSAGQNNSSSSSNTNSTNTSKSDSSKTDTVKPDKSKKGKFPYKDGVYLGTGEGYKGDITIALSIKNKTIETILVIDTSDDERFFTKAKALINNVLKEQSVKVDAVSGATFSSEGIIEAIKDALKSADKATNGDKNDKNNKPDNSKTDTSSKSESSSKADDTSSDSGNDSSNSSASDDTSSSSDSSSNADNDTPKLKYKDGTYSAIAVCSPGRFKEFKAYTVSVTVTIKDDKITDITDIKGVGDDYDDSNDFYLKRAVKGTSKYKSVVTQMLEKNLTDDIDAVSGATCSSEAIIKAVKEALESALNIE